MAAIIIENLVKKISTDAFGKADSFIGQSILGSYIDNYIGNSSFDDQKIQGRRLHDLNIQTSTYGRMIPIIYGKFRIAGNIIWGMPIDESIIELINEHDQVIKEYNYSVTIAIAICEGVIDSIDRIWANGKLLDLSRLDYFRIYKGDESQLPDTLIESFTGKDLCPAYRGVAYIVIKDLPLKNYGNRIPNFNFEVKNLPKIYDKENLENMIKSMVLIPGSGEFVYDTIVQSKISRIEIDGEIKQIGIPKKVNKHTHYNKTDAIVALNQLQDSCPNINWVAPVVTWFANTTDIGNCKILPAVEYSDNSITIPDEWRVANYNRYNAYLITRDIKDNPNYGGSINDQTIIRFLDELKDRNLKIMFYPMFFIDLPKKPWRGRLSGNSEDIKKFFCQKEGYNDFILHYANLVKDRVDAFIIGSELIGLTRIKDKNDNFPAVDELINLAKQVREILGKKVLISYAADWSEYHHTRGGWYNLDPLWSSEYIDFVGIDAYFPLTDNSNNKYDKELIKKGWESGEGYDFYIENGKKIKLNKEYAWKNIEWWWSNYHVNPNGVKTNWSPKSKKIWFTEYGFPSVNNATNQPNVFYDPNSIEGNIPKNSNGKVDFHIQRIAIEATEEFWANSDFLEQKFLWTWDMRPYPLWPDRRDIWRDHGLWSRGHWVSGKIGVSDLGAIIADLCDRAKIEEYDISRLSDIVDGFIINNQQTIRSAIETLSKAYFFNIINYNSVLEFSNNKNYSVFKIDKTDLVDLNNNQMTTSINSELDLPYKIDIHYIDKYLDYESGLQSALKSSTNSNKTTSISLPIVFSEQKAKNIAEIKLYEDWSERRTICFILPTKYLYLNVGDIISFNTGSEIFKIIRIDIIENRMIKITAISKNINIYDYNSGADFNYYRDISSIHYEYDYSEL